MGVSGGALLYASSSPVASDNILIGSGSSIRSFSGSVSIRSGDSNKLRKVGTLSFGGFGECTSGTQIFL